MIVKLDNKSGVKLKTYKKYCNEDIEIMPILREKQVLRNGKYIAPSGCVGFDEIEVNVDYIDEEIKGEGEFWVRFVDFKGNIIEQLRADTGTFVPFPTPPVIDGYTFSGWACNMPFEDGGIVVNDNNVYCGALYITSDEKTRIYLNITDENMLTFELCYYQNQAGGVEVDFGDGSQTTRQESVGAQVIEHTFPSVGRYVVTLDFNEGVLGFLGTNASSKGMLGSLNGSHLDYQKFITKVEIGRGVNFIGAYAFAHCVNLQQINLPDGVKVEESSFENCHSLECLIIPNNTLKNTPKNLLSKCYNLKHLVIPYNYVKINNYFSDYCVNLKRIALPYLLTEIGEHAFSHCNGIREVIMPDSLAVINDYVFNSCSSLTAVKWPVGLNKMGAYSFFNCGLLKQVNLYDNLIYIGEYAFAGCKKINEIEIPASVKQIGAYAFSSTPSLKKISFMGEQVSIGDKAFNDSWSLVDLTLPSRLYELSDCLVNNHYLKNIKMPSSILSIKECFSGMKCLENVDMQDVKGVPTLADQTYFENTTNPTLEIWVKGDKMYYYLNAEGWNKAEVAEKIVCKQTAIENPGNRPILMNEHHIFELSYGVENGEEAQFLVSSSNEQIVKVNSYTAENNLLSINLSSFSRAGECEISVTMNVNGNEYNQTFKVIVLSSQPSYSVEVENLQTGYNFALDSQGYYVNSNKGIGSSVCLSKIKFNPDYENFYDLYAECYNSSQENYDYGTISKLNLPLENSLGLDSELVSAKCFITSNIASENINLGLVKNKGDFVYLKYVKNAYVNSNEDTFKVKFKLVRNTSTLV